MMTLKRFTRGSIVGLGLATILVSATGIVFAQYAAPSNSRNDANQADKSGTPANESDTQSMRTPGTKAEEASNPNDVDSIIANWPKDVKAQAAMLIERYGKPSTVDAMELSWNNNGPWKKTVLHRDGFTQSMLGRDRDHLEQTIVYKVPEDKIADLQRFDKRLEVDQAAGELTSHADSESMNYLALNLANDIVTGQRNVQAARTFYQRVKMFEKVGKTSPYLNGFVFALDGSGKTGATDSDKSSMKHDEATQYDGETAPSR
jgi:hypothetical protein